MSFRKPFFCQPQRLFSIVGFLNNRAKKALDTFVFTGLF